MRVLMTTDTVGGVWTFTRELATGLLERGCAVSLVSFGRMPSHAQRCACDALRTRFGAAFRYTPSSAPLEWMEPNDRTLAEGARVLQHEAARFGPDLMHANQFCFGALQAPFPRLVTAHSDVLSWAKACRTEPLASSPWLHRYIQLVQEGLNHADAVTAPTQWMMEALAQGFQVGNRRSVIPNGIAIASHWTGTRALQAVTAGRLWDEAKDVKLLDQVSSPMPILVAGETDRAERHAGLIHSVGQLSHEETLALFRSSAVYICTSRYEPFGLAPLEAALCGCAVLARDIPSLREVWGEGALNFESAVSLTGLLQQLYSHSARLRAAQQRSMQRAQVYSRERMVTQYLQLYQHTLMHAPRIGHVA